MDYRSRPFSRVAAGGLLRHGCHGLPRSGRKYVVLPFPAGSIHHGRLLRHHRCTLDRLQILRAVCQGVVQAQYRAGAARLCDRDFAQRSLAVDQDPRYGVDVPTLRTAEGDPRDGAGPAARYPARGDLQDSRVAAAHPQRMGEESRAQFQHLV